MPDPAHKKPCARKTTAQRAASYARSRLKLISQLGGRCIDCGHDNPLDLEFHHRSPRAWEARKTSRWVRLARYRREAAAGEVELLCGPCNRRRGKPAGYLGGAVNDEAIPE